MYQNNCFITLTYNDANLPPSGSLDLSHFQKFMKRLRKKYGAQIRFYHCGEYGEKFRRPHYHACLFNHDFEDKVLFKVDNKNALYTSSDLESLWPFGFSLIGDLTFQSAAYVARYILKKINGEPAANHYENVDLITGEIHELKPEYCTMSRRPGIGSAWIKKYNSDVYPGDFVVINGKRMKPPKYYDRQYELTYPQDFASIRGMRVRNAKLHVVDNTPERLAVRENCQQARMSNLPRKFEEDEQ